jgi:hypothetical protein
VRAIGSNGADFLPVFTLWVQHNKSFFVNFANSALDIVRVLPYAAASLREMAD